MRKQDREKFVRLANKRVNTALKALQLIGNLSNRSNYEYTEDDVSKVLKALQDELNSCRRRFETASRTRGNAQFSLD